MKRLLVLLLSLLLCRAINAQTGPVFKSTLSISPCDTCAAAGAFGYNRTISMGMLGAVDEFILFPDSLAGAKDPDVLKFLTISGRFKAVFLSDRTVNEVTPPELRRGFVAPKDLEFRVLKNGRPTGDWKPVTALPAENNPSLSASELKLYEKLFSNFKPFEIGDFSLKPNDYLLFQVRQQNTETLLTQLYILRVKMAPEVRTATQFPVNTSIQNILNQEVGETTRLTKDNELPVEKGHSLLLSFDKGRSGHRMIEFSFTGESWQKISPTRDEGKPGSNELFYLFIDDPEDRSKQNIYLRFSEQPESVKHIKIIIRPAITKSAWIKIAASLVLAFLLFMIGFYFNRRRNKQQLARLQQNKNDLENKLELLSGQFNPHFLFNTLNSIQNLVQKKETDKASDYIATVASFLRTVMVIGKKEYISLAEELNISETYLQLEQNRKKFHYEIIRECKRDLSKIDFPPLLLQPVLENSIHHGFKEAEGYMADIIITVTCDDKDIAVRISDSGSGFNTAEIKKGYGLGLVEKRIKMINEKQPGRLSMEVTSAGKGTETIFTLKDWI